MNKESAIEALQTIDVKVYRSSQIELTSEDIRSLQSACTDLRKAVESDAYATRRAHWICELVSLFSIGSDRSAQRQEILEEAKDLSGYIQRKKEPN